MKANGWRRAGKKTTIIECEISVWMNLELETLCLRLNHKRQQFFFSRARAFSRHLFPLVLENPWNLKSKKLFVVYLISFCVFRFPPKKKKERKKCGRLIFWPHGAFGVARKIIGKRKCSHQNLGGLFWPQRAFISLLVLMIHASFWVFLLLPSAHIKSCFNESGGESISFLSTRFSRR